ncbi:MAG: DUF1905 domain-containing protein [Deltaproteobacteria bacterium]|nr:DUF1905 domain-containing protein [Deltaproteobacteria bacterium]
MAKARFESELFEGHKGVCAVIVPFDPEERWGQKPVRLAGRRHGWLVRGSVNGTKYDGYIGDRWGRFFIALDDEFRDEANLKVGDTLALVLEPTKSERTYAKARAQSQFTTQPGKPRPDAVAFSSPKPNKARARR